MIKRMTIAGLAACALAGCGAPESGNSAPAEPVANDVAGNGEALNYQAEILGLNDGQRNGVLLRAIRDAGLSCQGVTESTRIDDQDGQPTWRAQCSNDTAHIVSFTVDGTANIVSRSDR